MYLRPHHINCRCAVQTQKSDAHSGIGWNPDTGRTRKPGTPISTIPAEDSGFPDPGQLEIGIQRQQFYFGFLAGILPIPAQSASRWARGLGFRNPSILPAGLPLSLSGRRVHWQGNGYSISRPPASSRFKLPRRILSQPPLQAGGASLSGMPRHRVWQLGNPGNSICRAKCSCEFMRIRMVCTIAQQ